ncbi:MAG: tRNA lysidine(34) synthetase TilS [Ruthenibacterium lactatiformans]
MDEFEARAGAYISQHQMLQKGDTVIVALSGGADSMALFHFLFSVQNVWGLRLRAAHVNHGLRGAAADGDAAFVRAQCAARGVPLDETLLSPPENAGEEWGRQERYAFFARLAQAHGAKVATAHTCSDNAETVLFNLARGSAARGAAGIPPVRGPYVRPLLWAQRADVLAYLARCGVPHVTDATNDTDACPQPHPPRRAARSGARAPGAARSITRFAAEMSAVADYLEEQAGALLEQACVPRAVHLPGNIPDAYCAQTLAAAPAAVRHTALARLIASQRRSRK